MPVTACSLTTAHHNSFNRVYASLTKLKKMNRLMQVHIFIHLKTEYNLSVVVIYYYFFLPSAVSHCSSHAVFVCAVCTCKGLGLYIYEKPKPKTKASE